MTPELRQRLDQEENQKELGMASGLKDRLLGKGQRLAVVNSIKKEELGIKLSKGKTSYAQLLLNM